MQWHSFRRLREPVLAVCLATLVSGCGDSPTKSASQDATPDHTPAISLQKPSWAGSNWASAASPDQLTSNVTINARKGGFLFVRFPWDYSGRVRVYEALLRIPRKALGASGSFDLTMEVNAGDVLDDISVVFGPSGTKFNPEATLTISIIGLVSIEQIATAQHIFGDGQVESIETEFKDGRWLTKVTIRVPGFSRYNFDDDEMDQESDF